LISGFTFFSYFNISKVGMCLTIYYVSSFRLAVFLSVLKDVAHMSCIISNEKSAVTLSFVPLYVLCLFFSNSFKSFLFLFIIDFEKSDCSFLYICAEGLSYLLDMLVGDFRPIWKLFGHYSFNISFADNT